MWRIFRVYKSCQWIKSPGRYLLRNFELVIMIVILWVCFLIVLSLYQKKGTNDVKKSAYVLEKEKEPFGRFIGTSQETYADKGKQIKPTSFPLLTLFTTWVDRKEKYLVQNRTIENWISFRPYMQPVIFTNDTKLESQCRHRGWNALTLKQTFLEGVPVLKYMYLDTMHRFNSTFYGYSNSDILFNDGLIMTLVTIREFIGVNHGPVIITGRRTNVDYKLPCNASDWKNITILSQKGNLVDHFSADYFITTKDFPWQEMEEILLGRMRTDNWIIQFSLLKNITVIDSTLTILALHQTTEAGNAESESKPNKLYNEELVRKVRNIAINVNQGQTDCAGYITIFASSKLVRLMRHTPESICNGVASLVSKNIHFHAIFMKCYFVLILASLHTNIPLL
ncbi:hypothetical protein CHS0354_018986 [Potamilus streckersoni]|uniref:Uncharacterized protein n=1 Tax=Potamilus streckersoni TaxID=2493646 RepID=A0AAE0SM79_9BIVA|nr:hypothetical protein CHS0354_018986 [Potamilus streckersoni]